MMFKKRKNKVPKDVLEALQLAKDILLLLQNSNRNSKKIETKKYYSANPDALLKDLQKRLDKFVAEEKFEDAARLSNTIAKVKEKFSTKK